MEFGDDLGRIVKDCKRGIGTATDKSKIVAKKEADPKTEKKEKDITKVYSKLPDDVKDKLCSNHEMDIYLTKLGNEALNSRRKLDGQIIIFSSKILDERVDKINAILGTSYTKNESNRIRTSIASEIYTIGPEKIKKILPELSDEIDEYIKTRNEQQKIVNSVYKDRFDRATSLYRGTRENELDIMLKTGNIGGGKPESTDEEDDETTGGGYDFTSTSVSEQAAGKFGNGIIIKYPKYKVKKFIVSQGYDVARSTDSLEIEISQGVSFLWEEEHRLPRNKIPVKGADLTIHYSIANKQDAKAFEEKYASLGKLVNKAKTN